MRPKDNADLINSINKLSGFPDELIIVYDIKNCGKAFEYDVLLNCKIIKIPYYGNGVQPHMRNLLLENASGDFIWFIDDDVTLLEDSVKEL